MLSLCAKEAEIFFESKDRKNNGFAEFNGLIRSIRVIRCSQSANLCYQSTMPDSTPVTFALDALAIPYRLFRHPGPVHSLEQAAQERGQGPEQVVRSIVFRVSGAATPDRFFGNLSGVGAEGKYVMVLIAGARQVSWPTLRRHLGQSRLTMATEAELLKVTGYPVGAVSPFGLPQPMRLLVDESVFAPDEVSIGAGERGLTVILRSDDLRRALGEAEVGEFGEG